MAGQSGRLEAIWLKRAHRGPMDPVSGADVRIGHGLEGDVGHHGRRQVTIIAKEAWDRMMRQLSASVDPSARRANLMVSGIDLAMTRDKYLAIGPCVIRIAGETRPCERMDEAYPGLRAAMSPDWNGGVFGIVVEGGRIEVDAPVSLHDESPAAGGRRAAVGAGEPEWREGK